MDCQLQVLNLAESYLQESISPKAAAIDSDPEALLYALKGFGELGLLALWVPKVWGGSEVSEETFHTFQELVARYSGALAGGISLHCLWSNYRAYRGDPY